MAEASGNNRSGPWWAALRRRIAESERVSALDTAVQVLAKVHEAERDECNGKLLTLFEWRTPYSKRWVAPMSRGTPPKHL